MTFTADATQKLLQLGATENWTIDYDNGSFTITNDTTGKTFDFDGSGQLSADELNIPNTGADPTQNGVITNNGGVLKAQSNGVVKDILAEGSGSFNVDNIVFVGNGDTIQSAINTVGGSGRVFITNSYDPSFETFPIDVNYKVEIVQAAADRIVNPTTNDATPKDTFNINLSGPNEFPGCLFRNVTVEGGRDGFHATEARYVTYDNCLAEGVGRHGFHTVNSGTTPTSYLYQRCVGEDCGGDGFRITGDSIGHTFYDCTAEQNVGAGIRSTGTAVRLDVLAGSFQLNQQEGLVFGNGFNASQLLGCYIESNDSANNYVRELYIDEAFGSKIELCRFNGFGNVSKAIVRGPNYGEHFNIKDCSFFSYTGTVIEINAGRDTDLYLSTHYYNSVGGEYIDNGISTRSHGVILPSNLGAPANSGDFNGDMGIADPATTTSGNPEFAIWLTDTWYTWGGDTFVP